MYFTTIKIITAHLVPLVRCKVDPTSKLKQPVLGGAVIFTALEVIIVKLFNDFLNSGMRGLPGI